MQLLTGISCPLLIIFLKAHNQKILFYRKTDFLLLPTLRLSQSTISLSDTTQKIDKQTMQTSRVINPTPGWAGASNEELEKPTKQTQSPHNSYTK